MHQNIMPGFLVQGYLDSSLWADLEQVTDLNNSLLCAPFSEEEVKEALYQMEKKQGSRP